MISAKMPLQLSSVFRFCQNGAADFRFVAMVLFLLSITVGCGGSGEQGGKLTQPVGHVISGKVTMEDGSPLRGEVKDIRISIYGVSEAAERVSYTPVVRPDGTYSQKVAGGQYAFNPASLVMVAGDAEFNLPLEPVGRDWNKNRDAEEGLVQDFLYKVTGPTPYGRSNGLKPGDHTHWYGQSIGILPDGYRNDIQQATKPLDVGTQLTFTLKPTGPSIDGRTIEPVTVERTYTDRYASLDLNDLVPAPYELRGSAKLPDGTVKPLLLQARGDYPNYKPAVTLPLENDGSLSLRIHKHSVSFVIE